MDSPNRYLILVDLEQGCSTNSPVAKAHHSAAIRPPDSFRRETQKSL